MVIEIWECLRGRDKWSETQARIELSDVEKKPLRNRFVSVGDSSYPPGDRIR
jgi:hypothetical protein